MKNDKIPLPNIYDSFEFKTYSERQVVDSAVRIMRNHLENFSDNKIFPMWGFDEKTVSWLYMNENFMDKIAYLMFCNVPLERMEATINKRRVFAEPLFDYVVDRENELNRDYTFNHPTAGRVVYRLIPMDDRPFNRAIKKAFEVLFGELDVLCQIDVLYIESGFYFDNHTAGHKYLN